MSEERRTLKIAGWKDLPRLSRKERHKMRQHSSAVRAAAVKKMQEKA